MLRQLVRFSLHQRFLVVAIAAGVVAAGVASVLRSPVDVFPEFAPPLVEVQVEAPGMSSEAVERLVTVPLEANLSGLPRMTTLRSKSVQGVGSVQMIFEQGSDVFAVRQMVNERVSAAARQLPPTVKPPQVLPPLSSTSRILKLGLTPKKGPDGKPLCTTTDISVLMRWTIEPRLRGVPGVSNVSTYGQHDRNYQVRADPARLAKYGVTLDQLRQATSRAVVIGSAGFLDNENQRMAIQYATRLDHFEDLRDLVVAQKGGQTVYLSQVADLDIGSPPGIGEGVVNDEVGLLVVIEKYPWANTFKVTQDVEKAVDALRPGLPNVEINTTIFRPATFIERAVHNLRHAMLLGCVLVALIVIAFLMDLRTAVISLTAIPLSIVAALLVLNLAGYALNTMILAGLVIAVGEVVDDAIIDVENITRRLRQQGSHSRLRVVLAASLEVRSAVVYATAIVALVCLPIFFLGGVAGSFFRPLATAYILAVVASLLVAVTVTPALSLMLLPGNLGERREPLLARAVRSAYRVLLAPVLRVPIVALAGVVALAAGAVLLLPSFKEEYLPQFQETDFLMHWIAKPGVSLAESTRDIQRVSSDLRKETAVRDFGSHIARAEIGEEIYGSNFAELWVSLKDDYGDYAAARKKIMSVLDRHAGYEHDLLTYLQERIKEVLTGTGASVVVRIYGPDLATLRGKAKDLADAINGKGNTGKVPGVVDLKVEAQALVPQLNLTIDARKCAALGLAPGTVADAVTIYVNGLKVGDVHQDQRVFDLVLLGKPELRENPWPALLELPIDVPQPPGPESGRSATVPLKDLATLEIRPAPNIVRHDKASRCIDVTCNVQPGSDLGAVVREIQKRAEPLNQEGYRLEFLGEYAARQENQRQLLGVGLLAVLGIVALLYSDFRSWRLTLLVFLTLPFALIGGVYSAYLTGGVLSLGSLVGFITVLGIAARNGIMLVSHYRHLQEVESMPFGRELVLRGATERVVPILMTALAAGLGLLPLALGGNQPGYEIEYPMAIVILGGLLTSTVLNLLVVPALYQWIGRPPRPSAGGATA
jgi:CzcA family heavy metal efflux pump